MRWVLALLSFTLMVGVVAPYSAAAAEFGAIAVVPRQGVNHYGFSAGSSKTKAREAAVSKCGQSRCKVVADYRPGQCAIMALGKGQVFWNTATPGTLNRERRVLTDHCKRVDEGCRIILEKCLR